MQGNWLGGVGFIKGTVLDARTNENRTSGSTWLGLESDQTVEGEEEVVVAVLANRDRWQLISLDLELTDMPLLLSYTHWTGRDGKVMGLVRIHQPCLDKIMEVLLILSLGPGLTRVSSLRSISEPNPH